MRIENRQWRKLADFQAFFKGSDAVDWYGFSGLILFFAKWYWFEGETNGIRYRN